MLDGNITEIHCTYDPESRSGSNTEASKRNVKGTLHWVSIAHAVPAEVRLYDRLFNHESPDGDKDTDFMQYINPDSLKVITGYVEPFLDRCKNRRSFSVPAYGVF